MHDAPSRLALLRTRVRPADIRDVSRAPVLLERACGPVLGAANSSGQEAGLASLIACLLHHELPRNIEAQARDFLSIYLSAQEEIDYAVRHGANGGGPRQRRARWLLDFGTAIPVNLHSLLRQEFEYYHAMKAFVGDFPSHSPASVLYTKGRCPPSFVSVGAGEPTGSEQVAPAGAMRHGRTRGHHTLVGDAKPHSRSRCCSSSGEPSATPIGDSWSACGN